MKWGVRKEVEKVGKLIKPKKSLPSMDVLKRSSTPMKNWKVHQQLRDDQKNFDNQGGYKRKYSKDEYQSMTRSQQDQHYDKMKDALHKAFPESKGGREAVWLDDGQILYIHRDVKQLIKDPTGKNRNLRVDVEIRNGVPQYVVYDKTSRDYSHTLGTSAVGYEDMYTEDQLQDLIDKYGESGWTADMVYEKQFKKDFERLNNESMERSKELNKRLGKSKFSQIRESIKFGAKKVKDTLKVIGNETVFNIKKTIDTGKSFISSLFGEKR